VSASKMISWSLALAGDRGFSSLGVLLA
jgi:hypothetical protein